MPEAITDWIADHAPVVIAIGVGVVIAAYGLTRPVPAAIEVRPREAQPSPTTVIYVHVDGAVTSPGVYPVPAGSRLFEVVDLAGGATEEADLHGLNLASRVTDGQKLIIPAIVTAAESPAQPEAAAAVAAPAAARATATGPSSGTAAAININTASQRALEALPGIGPVTAQRIIAYRETNGPFTRIDQLRDARLVNAPTYERIRTLVSVN